MAFDCPMPTRPLNIAAAVAADNALYHAHRADRRPNALYDAAGRRQRLDAMDPSQHCLRDEWVEQYAKNGGKVEEPKPSNAKAPKKHNTALPAQEGDTRRVGAMHAAPRPPPRSRAPKSPSADRSSGLWPPTPPATPSSSIYRRGNTMSRPSTTSPTSW